MLPPLTSLSGAPFTPGARAILFVNVASRCGLTPQYTALEALHERLKDRGFSVVGVPCNQFGGQEPGTAEEIQTFCSTRYGVSFPLLEKQDVNGKGRSPLYEHLVGGGPDIGWNFEKFLVKDGEVVARFDPGVTPDAPLLVGAIEAALA